jgi:hypothetical protein
LGQSFLPPFQKKTLCPLPLSLLSPPHMDTSPPTPRHPLIKLVVAYPKEKSPRN